MSSTDLSCSLRCVIVIKANHCSLCRHLTYLAAAAAVITCVAAVPFLGLQSPGTATVAGVDEALGC